jgi:hypothetical protein
MFFHCSAKIKTGLPRKIYNCQQLNNLFLQDLQRFIDESPDGVLQTEAESSVEVGDRLVTCTAEQLEVMQMAATVRHVRCVRIVGLQITTTYINFS